MICATDTAQQFNKQQPPTTELTEVIHDMWGIQHLLSCFGYLPGLFLGRC